MAVTEQDLADLARILRHEFAEKVKPLEQELGVQKIEAHNRTAGITSDEVQGMIRKALASVEQLTVENVRAEIKTIPAPDPGLTAADVRQMITELLPEETPEPDPGLSRQEIERMIAGIKPYDDEDLKKRLLVLQSYSNGLADYIGAPRMEG